MDFLSAKHLFIDTNVLLSFYHFAGDDLEELKKLIVLLEQKKVKLYLPSQVISEFNRNREAKIADGLKRFKEQRLRLQFPQMCRDYAEYEKLRNPQRAYETEHTTLLNRLNQDVSAYDLKADRITSELFRLGTKIECSDTLVGRARTRFDLGNPPGKKGSLGDALNWEALLSDVPEKSDLHFISDDRDFSSALNDEVFNGFLADEWTKKKESTLIFYRRISAFFKEYFPDIKLAAEFEKDLLIADFTNSYNFARTHSVVAKLSKYTDFTAAQVNAIVSAAINNSQICSIIDDPDVWEFLASVVRGREDLVDEENLEIFRALLAPPKTVLLDDADVPF